MKAPTPLSIIKNDHTGREVWRYEGVLLERHPNRVVLEARFNRDDMYLDYVVFRRGDRFVEQFYSDRWYNIFEIHDVSDDHVKGWYCNFARPARFADGVIESDDLALDLWVYPDGRHLTLDRDEFDALPITSEERRAVLAALDELTSSTIWQMPTAPIVSDGV
jgi:hypothetical protein